MLGKTNRLNKDRDYRKVFRMSKGAYAGRLSIKVSRNPLSVSRFGIIISNKVEKRSTRRNALRRKLRAAIREMLPDLKTGQDVVIIVKGNYPFPYKFEEISKDLAEGLRKAGL